jgi:branched-chain amino acid transport system permease protein
MPFGSTHFARLISISRNYLGIGILMIILALVPLFLPDIFYLHVGNIVFLVAISALGFNFIFNSGQMSFGHAGFIAIGAYTSALLSVRLGVPFFYGFVLGGALTFIVAVVLGIIFIRSTGLAFILMTMAAGEVIRLFIINVPSLTFGTDGVVGIPPAVLPIVGLVIKSKGAYYYLNFSVAALVTIFLAALYSSPWGTTLKSVKDNPLLAECTGVDTRRYRILGFSIGCTIGAFSGSLLAHFMGFLSPTSFTFLKTLDALLANVAGGMGNLAGPIIGSILVASLPEFLRGFVAWQVALYGIILVLMLRFIPGGIVSLIPKLIHILIRKQRQVDQGAVSAASLVEVSDPPEAPPGGGLIQVGTRRGRGSTTDKDALRVENLTKKFGGLTAVSDVTFTVGKNEILGIIGPNGAGKTTLYNLMTGVIKKDKGSVLLNGEDISGFASHQIVRRGLSRTFQAVVLYPEATVWENVMRGMRFMTDMGFWRGLLRMNLEGYREAFRDTDFLLKSLDLYSFRNELPRNLPFGLQKQVQIAVTLATGPEVILLDEPVSGMNQAEANRTADLIRRVRDSGITPVIVEHNMNFVMNLCERIVVLDHGIKIAEGLPEDIRNNSEVIQAYLGAEDAT